jgi:hypothetical protein
MEQAALQPVAMHLSRDADNVRRRSAGISWIS